MTADETVLAKQAFERFAASHGIIIQNYHADNGRFANNKWRKECSSKGQTFIFVELMPISKMESPSTKFERCKSMHKQC